MSRISRSAEEQVSKRPEIGSTSTFVWVVLLVFVCTVSVWVSPLTARAQGDDSRTWSIRPTPTDDQPDRPNFSFDLAPGDTVSDSVRVRNFGTAVLPLAIYATDAFTTPSGVFDLLPTGETPTGLGSWITLDLSQTLTTGDGVVLVPGQGYVDIPFVLVAPTNAESGDHSGGIVTSYVSEGADGSGQPVVYDHRLANRVHVRIGGQLSPGLEVSEVDTRYRDDLNPFTPGVMSLSYTVTNTGNVRVTADQMVKTRGLLGLTGTESVLSPMPELLPGSSLRFTAEIPGVWPALRTEVTVEVVPQPVRPGDFFEGQPATAAITTWTVPWPQLVLLVPIAGLMVWRIVARKRRAEREAAADEREDRIAARVQEAVDAALAAHGITGDNNQSPDFESEPTNTETEETNDNNDN